MSLPTFPVQPAEGTVEQSIAQILTSIAMEEIGLSHIINTEGEKLQYVLGTLAGAPGPSPSIPQLLEVSESVKDMLSAVSANQMFLFGKMSLALNTRPKDPEGRDPGEGSGGSDKPLGVVITTNRGRVYGNFLYLPQGTPTELDAIVITSGDGSAVWNAASKPGFTFTADKNKASVKIAPDTASGATFPITATAAADTSKYDTKMVVVIDAAIKDVVLGGDGNLYADYGDNTFKAITPNGAVTGGFICAGMDRNPGTADDRDDVSVSDSGIKYLGPNADGSYQKVGPDGLLGTVDDLFVWPHDGSGPIGPCNETGSTTDIQVRNIHVLPSDAQVRKGTSLKFTAIVYMSDDSVDPEGVTWELDEVVPAGSSSISEDGWLTVGQDASRLVVYAVSKTNPLVRQAAQVTLKAEIQDVPTAVSGRILGPELTGDTIDWVEIARNGGYSLIIRTRYINTSGAGEHRDDPLYQSTWFGANNHYENSNVQELIGNWFTGEVSNQADHLPATANLRGFTVNNTARQSLGIGAAGPGGKNDSFSKPIAGIDGWGWNVPFALSYSEAANFVSTSYSWGGGINQLSGEIPAANFARMQIPGTHHEFDKFWLRSPGTDAAMASTVSHRGMVFQAGVDGSNGGRGLIYPALWVDAAIFG